MIAVYSQIINTKTMDFWETAHMKSLKIRILTEFTGEETVLDLLNVKTVLLLFDPVLRRSHKVPPVGTPGFFKGSSSRTSRSRGSDLELP